MSTTIVEASEQAATTANHHHGTRAECTARLIGMFTIG
jgi:hypothetical protein